MALFLFKYVNLVTISSYKVNRAYDVAIQSKLWVVCHACTVNLDHKMKNDCAFVEAYAVKPEIRHSMHKQIYRSQNPRAHRHRRPINFLSPAFWADAFAELLVLIAAKGLSARLMPNKISTTRAKTRGPGSQEFLLRQCCDLQQLGLSPAWTGSHAVAPAPRAHLTWP